MKLLNCSGERGRGGAGGYWWLLAGPLSLYHGVAVGGGAGGCGGAGGAWTAAQAPVGLKAVHADGAATYAPAGGHGGPAYGSKVREGGRAALRGGALVAYVAAIRATAHGAGLRDVEPQERDARVLRLVHGAWYSACLSYMNHV